MVRPAAEGWRSYALRRVLGRFKIGPDIIRHLSTFQRLGATMDVAPPADVLPIGARTVLRAIRTRGAVDISPDWLWPRWLAEQLDPTSPSFTPRGHLPVLQNVTHRNWTLVGNPWSTWEAVVDGSGLVSATADGWSLDWWVRDLDGWRFPSREEGLRQRLLGATPVLVTTMDVDGGEVLQRVYAVEVVPELVVVEVENRTSAPLEVAFAVRPYNPEGLAVVEQLALQGTVVEVDHAALLRLPDVPHRWLLSTFDGGDTAHLLHEDVKPPPSVEVRCRTGLAQGAFCYELEPGDRLRAVMPVAGRAPRTRWRVPWRRPARACLPEPGPMPPAEHVAEVWEHRLQRGLQVELPDDRIQEAVDANRAYLLLLHDPGSITAGPATYHRFWFRDAAYQLAALDRWGLHAEAADVLATYPQRQRRDGYFYSQWREWDANGAAIWTIAEHHRLARDEDLLARLAPAVAHGAAWIDDMCARDNGKTPQARGLLPAGISAEHFGPFDYYYWDDLWAWRGLLDAAAVARWSGQGSADQAEAAAERLRDTLLAAIEVSAERAGRRVITAGPARAVDAGMIGGLAACWPLDLLAHDDPWITATADLVRERFTLGPAFFQGIAHTGLGTYLTLQLAFVELLAGDLRCWERLEWLLDVATPTFTWPEAVHPRLDGGCMGDGHHGWMAADLLNFVRALLVREDAGGLALLSVLPPSWRGRRLVVRDAPTHHGRLSYTLDWEDGTAVLEWEAEDAAHIRAPSLDPSWSSQERSGRVRF